MVQQALQRGVTGIHRALYRATGGVLGGSMGKAPVLLLTTVGRKTGKERTTPLIYVKDGEDLIVVASNAGRDWHPAWYLNLKSRPEASVQVRRMKTRVRVEEVSAQDGERLWPLFIKMFSSYAGYQKRTKRVIPFVRLRPVPPATR